jgi:hypothetical protein
MGDVYGHLLIYSSTITNFILSRNLDIKCTASFSSKMFYKKSFRLKEAEK